MGIHTRKAKMKCKRCAGCYLSDRGVLKCYAKKKGRNRVQPDQRCDEQDSFKRVTGRHRNYRKERVARRKQGLPEDAIVVEYYKEDFINEPDTSRKTVEQSPVHEGVPEEKPEVRSEEQVQLPAPIPIRTRDTDDGGSSVQGGRCTATTARGTRCKRKAVSDGLCPQHSK